MFNPAPLPPSLLMMWPIFLFQQGTNSNSISLTEARAIKTAQTIVGANQEPVKNSIFWRPRQQKGSLGWRLRFPQIAWEDWHSCGSPGRHGHTWPQSTLVDPQRIKKGQVKKSKRPKYRTLAVLQCNLRGLWPLKKESMQWLTGYWFSLFDRFGCFSSRVKQMLRS